MHGQTDLGMGQPINERRETEKDSLVRVSVNAHNQFVRREHL